VTDTGSQPHEMTVVKLNGITADQLKTAFSTPSGPSAGPPPFDAVGGVSGITPGASAETTLMLTAGEYALLCFLPDTNTGAPHAALGMVTGLSVK